MPKHSSFSGSSDEPPISTKSAESRVSLTHDYVRETGEVCTAHPVGDCCLSGDRRKSAKTLMENYRDGNLSERVEIKSGIPQGRRDDDEFIPTPWERYGDYAARLHYISRKLGLS